MDLLPLFFDLRSSCALVAGGQAATRKIDLLLKAGCRVIWLKPSDYSDTSQDSYEDNDQVTKISTFNRELLNEVHLVVAAYGDERDKALAKDAKSVNLPINVVNRVELSSFVFPSIIDRSPVIAAVSSSGELPVLTRLLRSRLEASIPHAFGRLADVAKQYRSKVHALFSDVNSRRRFWEKHLEGTFAELVFKGDETAAAELLEQALGELERNSEFHESGEVYLVGAGPGDPDLLTFKALRLIRQADVVLYDRLVSKEIMALVRQDAELINVGKARSNHTLPQESINQLLVDLAKNGHRVLRLKGGDPFIFGRGGEEIELLAANQVAFQVVPGVTAAAGCAAYSGIPLTHRDFSQSVRFITGHLKNNTCDLPWSELVHDNQTIVFYMGLASLSTICEELVKHGLSKDKPAALVSKGTTREQKVVTGTVSTLVELAEVSNIKAPTIIIVGDVVTLRERLKWR